MIDLGRWGKPSLTMLREVTETLRTVGTDASAELGVAGAVECCLQLPSFQQCARTEQKHFRKSVEKGVGIDG